MKTNNNINNLYNNHNIKETFINKNDKNNSCNNNIESFKVYIRIRPYTQKDLNNVKNNNLNNSFISKPLSSPHRNSTKNNFSEKMIKVENNILYLEDIKSHKTKNNKIFSFDNIFTESSNNEEVFNESIKAMIDKIIEGYNSTALAYGVTGTGKTYTIFGDLSNNFKEEGIIFKACDYLFEKIAINKKEINNSGIDYYIKVSYIEIYNEIVKDLIIENSTSLIIVEDPQKGVICPNAKEIIISDSVELKKIINESNKRRTMASTNQNQFSSRSHAILQMTLEKKIKKEEDNYEIYFSKFLVVDLAGSERGMERGRRREEGVNINKSLFTLGSCLNILSEKSNMGKFVPYRDSKLTRLLKDSLGGNILTVMLACISPLSSSYDETLNTLNYAFKTKKITKKVMKNIKEIDINNFQYKEIIETLKNEIMQLKKIIKNQELKLKEKIINDKEETNKENININENEIMEKKINPINKENLKSAESHGKFESKNLTELSDNNNYQVIEENEDFKTPNSEREVTYKEKEFKQKFDVNNIDQEINIDNYNKYIDEIINNELNLNNLNKQIESIKRDKNLLESYLVKDNIKNELLINKYNSIKAIYDKFIEIINEKLVENIEQNMIYNFNIKEITELNKTNIDKVKELEQQKLEKGEKNEKVTEEINYTNKNILENNSQKEQIYESIKKNSEQKDELKKILLNLLENKADSMNKYIHILKEKDKLFKITKQYEKEIEKYVKLQKQKEEDMVKINRKIEMLRAKLKEKDKKINELEKKGGKTKLLELNNIKSYNTNYYEKVKTNTNGGIPTESQIFSEKNKSPLKNNKLRMTSFKRDNSRNKNRDTIKSPINKEFKKQNITKKISERNNFEDKNVLNNKIYNNKKRFSIIQNSDNNKIAKRINIMNQYKTEINNEQFNNINEGLQHKYNEIIIPKTTITLTENDSKKIGQMKPIYLKTSKDNRLKKTPTNNISNFKKYSFINQQISKRNTSSDISKNIKKSSVKSIKIDFKLTNNSDLYLNQILNSMKGDKTERTNNNSDKNWANTKTFKAEKINIDLTNIDKDNISEPILHDKINNIKLFQLKKDKIKNYNQNGIKKKAKSRKLSLHNNKEINMMSKSNPKLSKEKISNNNKIRKLTLQEARYENKLKFDKAIIGKGELNYAESFINDYKKMKNKKISKNINNNNSMALLNKEEEFEESDSFYIDLQKIKNNKVKNNSKDKKKKEENEKNNLVKNNNTIVYNFFIKNNEKINLKNKKGKEKYEKVIYDEKAKEN